MAKDLHRRGYPRFSLCGLNCGLCPMFDEISGCPGCGGEGKSACAIVRCSRENGGVEYCCHCVKYPCERFEAPSEYDSFVSYRNVHRDFDRLTRQGEAAFQAELDEKVKILRYLLAHCNDGRKKSFLCTAVNHLALDDLRAVLPVIQSHITPDTTLAQNAAIAVSELQEIADQRGISLKLRRKPKK